MKQNFKILGKLISVLMIGALLFCTFTVGISAATVSDGSEISKYICDFEGNYYSNLTSSTCTAGAIVDANGSRAIDFTVNSNSAYERFEIYNSADGVFTLNDGNVYAVTVTYKVVRIGGSEVDAGTFINLVRYSGSDDELVKIATLPEAVYYPGDTTDWVTQTVVFKSGVASSPEYSRLAVNVISSSCPENKTNVEANTTSILFDNITVIECEGNTKALRFISNGGTYCDTILAQAGEQINLPTPTRDLFVFEGWYTDVGLKKAFKSTIMPKDFSTTLYAKWSLTDEAISVSYVTNGGETLSADVGREGQPLTLPVITRDNFHFAGWYDSSYTTRYEASEFPTESITLYAKWEAIPKLCSFENTDDMPKPDNAKFTQRCLLVTDDKYRGNQSVHYSFQRGFELTGSSGKNTPAGVVLIDEDGEYIALKPGTKYVDTFHYKVIKYNSNGWITLISASKNNAWSGRKVQDKDCVLQYDASDISKGWQTHSFTVTWDSQDNSSNYAYIGIAGDSEIYFDEILVYEYADNVTVDDSKAMLIFETGDGTIMDTVYAEYGTEYTLPKLQKDGYSFLGWFYDADRLELVESDKITLDKICTVLYADWYKIPPATESSESQTTNGDVPEPVVEDDIGSNNTTVFVIIAAAVASVVIIAVVVIVVVKIKKKKKSKTVEDSQQDGQDNE